MQEGERKAFDAILDELFGALDKPLTEAKRDGFWKGLSKMSLLEFARCRDLLLEELSDGEQRRNFSVPDVWAAKRRLRATGPQTIDQPQDNWKGDVWDIEANNHFLAYVVRQVLARRPISEQATRIFVDYKNAWARDMRESVADGTFPKDAGKAWFQDCMRRAERAIAQKAAA